MTLFKRRPIKQAEKPFARLERAVKWFAGSHWSSACVIVYGVVWFTHERGNIGFDGWLGLFAVLVQLAILRNGWKIKP